MLDKGGATPYPARQGVAETEEFYRLLGERVEQARRRRGLTQAALGRRLVPPQTRASISNIENGTQRVLSHTLVQLADAVSTPLLELLPPSDRPAGPGVASALAEKLQLSSAALEELVAQLEPDEGER